MQLGYEPTRISSLTRQSHWAVGALDGIHSADPAAVDAMAAIAGLKAVITDRLIPASTAVGIVDPLGDSADWLQIENLKPFPRSSYERWMDQAFPSTPHRLDTDGELLRQLGDLGENVPFEARSDPDHPYWDDFDDLADEISRRSNDVETGEITSFGQLLIDNIWRLPALPIAIATAEFDPQFSAAALAMIFDTEITSSSEVHRLEAFGADLILKDLTDHPDVLAELLLDDYEAVIAGDLELDESLLFQLLDSDVVYQEILADAIGAILDPAGPVGLGDIERLLVLFVQAANTSEFERGFSEPISLTLATVLVDLLPQLAGQIRLDQPIYFDEILDDEAILFGEYADVRDFIGAIIINPSGIILLLALGAEARDVVLGDGSTVDVQAFAELIREAFEENLDEIDIANARTQEQWSLVIAALATALTLGPVGKSLGENGVEFARALINRFGSVAAGESTESSSGEDVGHLAQIMILFGSYEGFLDDHDVHGRGDSTAAREKLAEAWDQFESGESLGKVSETLGDVADEITALGGRDFIENDVADAIHDIDPIPAESDL